MRLKSFGVPFLCVVFAIVVAMPRPLDAANKEHQQLAADLRMLQEQAQMLQNLIGSVTDALKAVNTRLDQQAETNRKAFADQKVVVDNLTNDVRVIREKLDDNNVRIGSLTQELDSLRQAMQQMSTRSAPTTTEAPEPTTPDSGGTPPAPTGSTSTQGVGVSPAKLLDAARGDYYAGQYDLAILGYSDYVKSFPKSDNADDAQVGICTAYYADKKWDKAVEACDLAIRNYPTGDKLPEAYYRKGLAMSELKDSDGARVAWEEVVKKYPDSPEAQLARQGLERLKRP
jgi:tol-pal system protein YbgF